MIPMHRSWPSHPVIGLGSSPKPDRNGVAYYSRFEAWFWLMTQDFVSATKTGNLVCLDRAHRHSWAPNCAETWNWRRKETVEWLARLRDRGLITGALFETLMDGVPDRRGGQRDPVPSSTRTAVLRKTSGKCVYCGVVLSASPGRDDSYQADHVLPVAKGGADDIANLVPSCARCNRLKSAKTLFRFFGGEGGA